MRVLLWLAILAGTAGAQYEVKRFDGPWLPGQQAAFMPPGAFTYSQNFFVQPGNADLPGYRNQRRGLTKALSSALSASQPILAAQTLWHEGDSLSIIFFCAGSWYFTSYADVNYGKSNWYNGSAVSNPSYISGYTLNAPKRIRPYSNNTVDVIEGLDSLEADNENASLFFRFTAANDSIYLDVDGNGTYEQKLGKVRSVLTNNRVLIDTAVNISTWANAGYQLSRYFSTTAIPDIEVYDRRAYVTNGVDPMQVIFWWDSTLWIREVHTAERVPMNQTQGWFKDSINDWISPAEKIASARATSLLDSVNLRFTRIYSFGKAWAPGEWAGSTALGPADMYFFRSGSPLGSTTTRQASVRIAPIFYNDENSLVLLNPLLGELDTFFRDVSIYTNYYPYQDQADTTSFHTALNNSLAGHEGYILSMAGNMEVVLPRSVTGTIKAIGNASVWVSTDQNVRDSITAGRVGFNDEIYFIHSFNPEQSKAATIVTQQSFTYRYFEWGILPSPLPDGWVITAYIFKDRNGRRYPVTKSEYEEDKLFSDGRLHGRGVTVKVPSIDTVEMPISTREYYHVRFAVGSSGGDSVIFITSNQPASVSGAPGSLDTVTITDWELVRAEVPRFSGIESHARLGLAGFGDTTDPGLVSRSAITIRGAEPENWGPAQDVRVTDEQDPITAIESYNNFETIFTTNQTFGATITSSGLWAYEELARNVGCIAPRSVVMVNDVLYFRAQDGFYRMRRRDLAGMAVEKISAQIDVILNPMDVSDNFGHSGTRLTENAGRRSLEQGIWDSRSKRIWWFLAMGSSNYPNYALTYAPETGVWDGVHTLGCATGITVSLRDTVHMLLTDPTRGMPVWANYGVTDSTVPITTALEGMIYGPAGDTTRVSPTSVWLTWSSGQALSGIEAPDTILWIMQNLKGFDFKTSTTDTARLAMTSVLYQDISTYTAVDRFRPIAGSAVFWRYRLEYKPNSTTLPFRFQPLRATIGFGADGIGD